MNNPNLKDKSIYYISLQATVFIVFLLITFLCNRFAVDDYYIIGELRSKSFIDVYKHLYFEWHGRWTSNFLLVGFIQLYKVPLFLFIYNFISVGLLYLSIDRLFLSINTFYAINLAKKQVRLYAVVALSVLFFSTISPADSWVWYTSSIVYLWSTTTFLASLTILFKKRRSILDYVLFLIGLIYIGGSNEPLTAFVMTAFAFLIIRKNETQLSISGLVVIVISFLINYLSPGTLNRDEITPSLKLIDLILYAGYGSVKFLLFSIYKTFIPAFLLAIPYYFLGKKSNAISMSFNPKKELIIGLFIIGNTVFLNQLLVVFALGGLAPDRSTIASTIVISTITIRYLFLLGNKHAPKTKFSISVLAINFIGLIVFTVYYSYIHFNYAKAVDERINFITTSDDDLIKLETLPKSGYIYSSEITTDPNHYKNQHLKSGLNLRNEIVLEP